MVADGNYTYSSELFGLYINVEFLCCPPETNIIFCLLQFSKVFKYLWMCVYI